MTRSAVLVIADGKQFPPAVFLASRLATLKPDRRTKIILATDWEDGLKQARPLPFELLDIRKLRANLDLPIVDYFTRATYFSLFVPGLLQDRFDRLLYLDVDTYAESSKVFDILSLDMSGQTIAAVRDLNIPFRANPRNGAELLETLKIAPTDRLGAKYLNSGVLLIDLHAYRRDRIERKAETLIREKRIALRYPDQTVFNAILRTRWLELSPSFNMITLAWSSFIRQFAPPAVVHFTGSIKPWHRSFAVDHPVRRELRDFLQSSGWPNFIAENDPVPNLIDGPLPPALKPQAALWEGEYLQAVVRYLRETPFADVEQGITVLDRTALPT